MAGEIDKDKSKDGDGRDGNDGNNTNGSRRRETRSIHELAKAQRAAALLGSWEMLAMYAAGAGVGGMADGGEVSSLFLLFFGFSGLIDFLLHLSFYWLFKKKSYIIFLESYYLILGRGRGMNKPSLL